MTAAEIVEELRPLGAESIRKVLRNHGVPEPVLGVRIADLQVIRKRIKKDYHLALDLYETGIYDARYLAGLVADDLRMTPDDLRRWVADANCPGLFDYTVPWVAAESRHGRELALEWIESGDEGTASAGWATLSGLVALKPDADLDLPALTQLLRRVPETIHTRPNRVRHAMNGFVISVGCYVAPLTALALEIAGEVGVVSVDMGPTACKVPSAADYIEKVRRRGAIGKKRKTIKC